MKRRRHRLLALVLLAGVTVFAGCRIADDTEDDAAPARAEPATTASRVAGEVVTPLSGYAEDVDPERIDAERYDSSWRDYATRDREYRASAMSALPPTTSPAPATGETGTAREPAPPAPDAPAPPAAPAETDEAGGIQGTNETGAASAGEPETWDAIAADAFGGAPRFPIDTEGGGPTVLRLQVLLDRAHFSPGVIDGRWGKNTEKAVYWLQDSLGMDPTGVADRALYDRLVSAAGTGAAEGSPVRRHRLTAADLEGPFVEIPEETERKAELDCLCYESIGEKLAETFHATPELLAKLNPDTDFARLAAGDAIQVPAVEVMKPGTPGEGGSGEAVARIVISRGGFYLQALDASGGILYHFPSTLGGEYDPSPDGSWKVAGVAWEPNFHYQPKLFSDVPDTEEDLMLPPGPNSPVGLIWMSLSKENYGIHGTAEPATIGYTSSHGCIRLTNWDAIFLGHHVKPGTPVEFRE